MIKKSIYEQLEKRIRELGEKRSEFEQIKSALKESEDRFKML
jgi:hypothetical protein